MLTIDAILKQTKNKGIGLFSNQNIKKGQQVWILENVFHKVISKEEYDSSNSIQRIFLDTYSTYHACGVNGYFLDLDNTRFINHSNTPNIEFDSMQGLALFDINIGDEIVCDYRKLSDDIQEKELGFENLE